MRHDVKKIKHANFKVTLLEYYFFIMLDFQSSCYMQELTIKETPTAANMVNILHTIEIKK